MLWVVSPKVFRLLRDDNFNFNLHSSSFQFRIAKCKPPPHSRYHHLTFDIWDFEFAVFPFPKVFRLIRNGSTSRAPPLIIDTDGNFDDIIVYSLAIALITPSPFCVTCLSRLAIWVLPATLLVHISDHRSALPLHIYHIILVSSYHPLCHKIVPAYTQLLSWFVHCAKLAIQKNLLSKIKRAKKLVSKCHSIITHCI